MRKSERKTTRFRWGKFVLKFFLACIILFLIFVLTVFFGFLGKIPSKEELIRVKTPLASEVFFADGKLMGRFYIENRSNVTYSEISPDIIHALVATEDVRFFKHRGIDEIALLRVFFKNILFRDRSAGGGSTLSQQIAKNLFPRGKLGIFTIPVSKIREAIIAYRLERIYSKEDILTLYLNTVPFGENTYGIEIASERFFSKTPSEITVPEAAVLIGVLKANNVFNPRLHPDKSIQRRNIVINQMVRQKFLTQREGEKYKSLPLGLHYSLITYNQGPAPCFLGYLRPELTEWCLKHTREDGEPYNLYTDGLKIYTTVDYDLQRFARNAVNEQMKSLQATFNEHWKNRTPWGDDKSVLTRAIKRTERYRKGIAAGKSMTEIMKEFSQPVAATVFTWDGLKSVNITPLDSVKHYLTMLNSGFVALENETGAIKAWIGDIDYRFFKLDYCNTARQVGSTFKPLIYLAALENGLSPYEYYPAETKTYEEYNDWTPENAHEGYTGYYTMKAGLAKSINTMAVNIIMQTGISNTVSTARNLGMKADLPEYPSLALGVASVPLQEMVSVFATIADLGKIVTPYALLQIENNRGDLIEAFKVPQPDRCKVDPENCRILIDMMQAAIDEGTGQNIRSKYKVPGAFAGKTGTTQEYADGWFIGFSPDLTAGCWVGADDQAIHFRSMNYGQGAYMALPVVGRFFSQLYASPRFKGWTDHRFEAPDSLTVQKMNELPEHVETLEPDRDFNFFDIFRKKEIRFGENKHEQLKKKGSADTTKESGKPVWEKIKDIFKKK